MNKRGSGILLHVSSLPSKYGIGDLGPQAYKFVDFLSETKQKYWQILPLNPTRPEHFNSPYFSLSAFAGNMILISPEKMYKDGFIQNKDFENIKIENTGRVDYQEVAEIKSRILHTGFDNFNSLTKTDKFEKFTEANSWWLKDFTKFSAFKKYFNNNDWGRWPDEIKNRDITAVNSLSENLKEEIDFELYLQYIFYSQWNDLKNYANSNKIQIIGDLPIYVNYDSADVWMDPEVFKLDENKKPCVVSGVPPDYFSETGQLWGNPIYNWDKLKETKYKWWIKRLEHCFKLYDITRIDHFRGLVAYWEVPAEEKTAINGKWVDVPVEDFMDTIKTNFSYLPVIAEDLGIITDDVKHIIKKYNLPGMKILLFAFNDNAAENPYIPHNVIPNCIYYTGTHDNNTARGWYENEADEVQKKILDLYYDKKITAENISRDFIRTVLLSTADTAIIPIQDFLNLGQKGRMNNPSINNGNWEWRLESNYLDKIDKDFILELTELSGRD